MKKIIICKKTQTTEKPVATLDFSGNYVEIDYAEKGVLEVLKVLFDRDAFETTKNGDVYKSEKIADKAKAFEHNVRTKLPSPYFLSKELREVFNHDKVFFRTKGKDEWQNRV